MTEPIALEEREPQLTDLDEEYCCWWWDNTDVVWERMRGDDRGMVSIRKINQKIDCPHYYAPLGN